MTESMSVHPGMAELTAFSQGLCGEALSAQIEQHLALCTECCRVLETIPDDRLTTLVRDGGVPTSAGDIRASLRPGYEVLDEIGRGGMGVVYRARQLGLGRIVALKRMHALSPSAEERSRFRREAESIARLIHPNIVQVFDFGEQDQVPFLALEYVDGRTLAQRLSAHPPSPRQAAELVEILARAVDCAHRAGIIHRDLKPGNILLAEEPSSPQSWGIPKITDFGLARTVDAVSHTVSGMIQGTPGYMAPEQITATAAAIGPAVDIYSLGAILYENLAGRPPFRAAGILETLHLASTTDPLPLRRLVPDVPRDLETIAEKCLDKIPARRYACAGALADDLRRYLEGQPIQARPAGLLERFWKWSRRRPAVAALIAAGLVSVLAAATGLVVHQRRLEAEVNRATAAEELALARVQQGYDALDQLLQEMYRDHPETEAFDALAERVGERALEFFYSVLAESDESHPGVRLAKGMLLTYAGSIHVSLQRFARSLTDLNAARQRLEPLQTDPLRRDQARWHLAACHRNLGNALRGLGRHEEAAREYETALAVNGELIAASSGLPGLLVRQAHCQELLATVHDETRRRAAAGAALQAAIELRRQDLREDPENIENQTRLALDHGQVSVWHLTEGRSDDAEAELQEAAGALQAIPEKLRSLGYHRALARICYLASVLELDRGRLDESLAQCDRGIAAAEAALAREPHDRTVRLNLHTLWRGKAWILCRSQRGEQSFPFWDRAIEFADGDNRDHCRAERALERALLGNCLTAAIEAQEISARPDLPENCLVHLARVYSRAIEFAPRDPVLQDAEACKRATREFAGKGVDCLRRAEGGEPRDSAWFDALETDPALAALRETGEYRAWRSRLGVGE